MKKLLLPLSGLCLALVIAVLTQGAVTYPPSGGSSTTVITNVTIITNVDIMSTTNMTVYQNFTVSGKASLTQVIVSNSIFMLTNSWPGPTNTLPLWKARQRYTTVTPISLTGYTGQSNYLTQPIMLSISNAATTNVDVRMYAGTSTPERTNRYTLSNGWTAKIWFEYDPSGPDISAVFRQVREP